MTKRNKTPNHEHINLANEQKEEQNKQTKKQKQLLPKNSEYFSHIMLPKRKGNNDNTQGLQGDGGVMYFCGMWFGHTYQNFR